MMDKKCFFNFLRLSCIKYNSFQSLYTAMILGRTVLPRMWQFQQQFAAAIDSCVFAWRELGIIFPNCRSLLNTASRHYFYTYMQVYSQAYICSLYSQIFFCFMFFDKIRNFMHDRIVIGINLKPRFLPSRKSICYIWYYMK